MQRIRLFASPLISLSRSVRVKRLHVNRPFTRGSSSGSRQKTAWERQVDRQVDFEERMEKYFFWSRMIAVPIFTLYGMSQGAVCEPFFPYGIVFGLGGGLLGALFGCIYELVLILAFMKMKMGTQN